MTIDTRRRSQRHHKLPVGQFLKDARVWKSATVTLVIGPFISRIVTYGKIYFTAKAQPYQSISKLTPKFFRWHTAHWHTALAQVG